LVGGPSPARRRAASPAQPEPPEALQPVPGRPLGDAEERLDLLGHAMLREDGHDLPVGGRDLAEGGSPFHLVAPDVPVHVSLPGPKVRGKAKRIGAFPRTFGGGRIGPSCGVTWSLGGFGLAVRASSERQGSGRPLERPPPGRRYRYYTCSTRYRYGTSSCDAERLPGDELEDAVLQQIADVFSNTSLVAEAIAEADAAEQRGAKETERRLAAIRRSSPRPAGAWNGTSRPSRRGASPPRIAGSASHTSGPGSTPWRQRRPPWPRRARRTCQSRCRPRRSRVGRGTSGCSWKRALRSSGRRSCGSW
jgi:hypothetical protein